MAKTNGKAKKLPALPAGYEELSSTLAGFFHRVPGNQIEGIYRGSFQVRGKFGTKNVHRIELSSGDTVVATKEGEETVTDIGAIIGLDETGYLKKLGSMRDGREVFVRCIEKGPDQKDPWIFQVAARPE